MTRFVRIAGLTALFAFVFGGLHGYAGEAVPLADDPVVEQQLNRIAEEMRCLVCQNESLAASRADLALDLRRELREQIKAGKSDAQIREFMVSRYGEFILYRPPVTVRTWLLWAGPFVLLLVAVVALFSILRRRTVASEQSATLSAEEQARIDALLKDKP